MYVFYIVNITFTLIEHVLGAQSKPLLLSNEMDVPTDSIIERLSEKYSILECTIKCLHHHSANCCGVGFLGEEMKNNDDWDNLTCFLLKRFECPSSNSTKLKMMVSCVNCTNSVLSLSNLYF